MKAMMLLNPHKRRRRRSSRRAPRKKLRMRRNPTRSHRRRRARRNPIGKHRNWGQVKRHRRRVNPIFGQRRRGRKGGSRRLDFMGFFSRDNLTVAGGAVLGTFATAFLLRQFGPLKSVNGVIVPKAPGEFKLPMSETPIGAVAYNVAIPALLAVLAQRFNPRLAQGAGIMAAVNLVSSVLSLAQGAIGGAVQTAAVSAYLDSNGVRALPNRPPGYDAVNAFGQSVYANESAFRGNTWALSE